MDETIHLRHGKFHHPPAKGTCAECPLRRDSKPGALGGWTVDMYIRGMEGPADFACHMSKGFDVQDLDAMRSCTGVANFRCNSGIVKSLPPGNARTAAEHAGLNPTDVFATARGFREHHTVENRATRRKSK